MNAFGNMASIWTPFTYTEGPYYRLALGIVLGLYVVCVALAVVLRSLMQKMNKQLERLENDDVTLTGSEIKELETTAQMENVSVAEARRRQKGFRYII